MKTFARNGGFTRFQLHRKEESTRVYSLIGNTNAMSASLSSFVRGVNLSSNQIAVYSASGLTGFSSFIHGSAGITGLRFFVASATPLSANELASKAYVDSLASGTHPLTGIMGSVGIFSTTSSLTGFQTFTYLESSGLRLTNNLQTYSSTASMSSMAFGQGSTASNVSFAFGNSTLASGLGSFALGLSAQATGESSVALGDGTTASAQWAFSSGTNTLANATKAIAMGHRSKASRTAQFSLANNGVGGTIGFNQFSILNQWVQTTDATPTIIAYDPNQYTMLLENNTIYSLWITVVCRSTNSTYDYGVWNFRSAVRRLGSASTTLIISNNRFADLVPSYCDCNISADTTNGALNILATGRSAYTFNWTATILFSEVHT